MFVNLKCLYISLYLAFLPFFINSYGVFADINLQGQMPHAQFSVTRYNLGTIFQGQVFTHQFPFQNTGNGTLILTSLHVSCGCMNAKILAANGLNTKNVFKPGEKGFVSVSFDSSQFVGPIVRTLTVETNADGMSPTITLSLVANVTQEISVNPAILYLGKIQKNSEDFFTLKVDFKKPNLKLIGVESDLPFLSAKIVPSTNSQLSEVVVNFQKTTTLPIGPFQGNLIIVNTSNHNKNFKVPVMGEVVGHVETSTKFLEFGVVNKGRFANRTISFQSKNDNFEITAVKVIFNNFVNFHHISQNDLFDIEKKQNKNTKKNQNNNEYVVEFKLKYPNKKLFKSNDILLGGVNVSGSFLIETNDPDYSEIKVPFFAILKQD